MRNCLDLRLQAGTWALTECHGGRPILSYIGSGVVSRGCHEGVTMGGDDEGFPPSHLEKESRN